MSTSTPPSQPPPTLSIPTDFITEIILIIGVVITAIWQHYARSKLTNISSKLFLSQELNRAIQGHIHVLLDRTRSQRVQILVPPNPQPLDEPLTWTLSCLYEAVSPGTTTITHRLQNVPAHKLSHTLRNPDTVIWYHKANDIPDEALRDLCQLHGTETLVIIPIHGKDQPLAYILIHDAEHFDYRKLRPKLNQLRPHLSLLARPNILSTILNLLPWNS